METLKNLDDKKLVDAGEVERVKAEAIKAVEEKYKPVMEERDALTNQLRQEKIGGSFARSQFIKEKMAVPVPMVERTFGDQFSIEDGRMVARDANGNPIYSKSKPGELAGFDEAIEIIVNDSPYRDDILRGVNQNGGGANGGGGGAGLKSMSAAAFDALSPKEQAAKMAETGFTLTD